MQYNKSYSCLSKRSPTWLQIYRKIKKSENILFFKIMPALDKSCIPLFDPSEKFYENHQPKELWKIFRNRSSLCHLYGIVVHEVLFEVWKSPEITRREIGTICSVWHSLDFPLPRKCNGHVGCMGKSIIVM